MCVLPDEVDANSIYKSNVFILIRLMIEGGLGPSGATDKPFVIYLAHLSFNVNKANDPRSKQNITLNSDSLRE